MTRRRPYDALCPEMTRRSLLGLGSAFAAWSLLPARPALAGTRDPRFLLVILRGALDGLATVMPAGDPDFSRLRAEFVEDTAKLGEAVKLDAMFSLHPAMKALAGLYVKREAVVLHAVATPYRQRSHFDGQEVLESGLPGVTHGDIGWLNRALSELKGVEPIRVGAARGLSIGPTMPLVMRGPAPVLSWSPRRMPSASDDTVARLLAVYEARDPMLAEALRRGIETSSKASGMEMQATPAAAMAGAPARGIPGQGIVLAMAEGAAKLLAQADGPRIGALTLDGWDTHAEQKPGTGRLARLLETLDATLDKIAVTLQPVWKDTVVVVVTEFGRTVRINGTAGTDHGTATAAFLLGGAVKGGRILADWPGLSERSLHEGRDLKPTTDLRAVLKGVLAEHLGIADADAVARIFPDSRGQPALRGLIA
jgi:uncharacterized protein (DUF1501 family)